MNKFRKLSNDEKEVIEFLINSADSKWFSLKSDLCSINVTEMDDGGMGSLEFEVGDVKNRMLGALICEAEFIDDDGVTVLVALNADREGRLFELDVGKVDFSKLIAFPDPNLLKIKNWPELQ
jgi:hypothetical protein